MSGVFIKANEKLLTNYIEPNAHDFNCIPCTLRLLQFINDEEANILSTRAKKNGGLYWWN